MSMHRAALAACLALCACSPPEIRVGASQGVPAIKGSSQFNLGTFNCGDPIQAGDGYTVTTMVTGSDCTLSFNNDVQVLKTSDYANIPDLKVTSSLLQSVDLVVTKLAFTDAATGTSLDFDRYVKTATLSVDGQQVADKATLAHLPTTVSLTGTALTQVKTAVDARQPCSVHVTSVLVVPQMPKPPSQLK